MDTVTDVHAIRAGGIARRPELNLESFQMMVSAWRICMWC